MNKPLPPKPVEIRTIVIPVRVSTPHAAVALLNQLWGYDDGKVPFDTKIHKDHKDATYDLCTSTEILIEVTFDKTGWKEFRVLGRSLT